MKLFKCRNCRRRQLIPQIAAVAFGFKSRCLGLWLLPDSFAALFDDGIAHHFC